MVTEDRTLACVECGESFVFSLDDQRYHQEKDYSDPKRCPSCRQARRTYRNQGEGGGVDRSSPREMYAVVCAQCGADAQVPFQPRGDRPVYCSDCFNQQRGGSPYESRRY